MGLLSDLLGGKTPDNSLLGAVVGKLDETISAVQQTANAPAQPAQKPAQPAADARAEDDYETVPAEENLFSFGGSFTAYFDKIFREEFPDYEISSEASYQGTIVVFTFCRDGRTALKVELLSQCSGAKKLRSECAKSGTPYLRFYYNHPGWWNTRSYVTERTRNALAGAQ